MRPARSTVNITRKGSVSWRNDATPPKRRWWGSFVCVTTEKVLLNFKSDPLIRWFPNFFKRDPNVSLMNISRPKPKTSKKCRLFYVLRKRKCFKLLYYYIAKSSYYQPSYSTDLLFTEQFSSKILP